MSQPKPEDLSYEMKAHQELQVVYGRKTQERQIFMEDLKDYRKRKDKALIKEIKKTMGTKWYQALSVPQLRALDSLDIAIYQDLLEGRPTRTKVIIKALGIIPRPRTDDLMHCIMHGRDDSKEMFAQLFLIMYEHTFDLRRMHYDLNARLMLSSIFYLGLSNLIQLLKETFAPDKPEPPPPPKKKPKPEPALPSPYLAKMTAVLYKPKQYVQKPPPPLPELEDLNEPVDETPPAPKPPPPAPPPPPPKKRIPVSYCDRLAGYTQIQPLSSVAALERKQQPILSTPGKKLRRSKLFTEEKKVYGIGNTRMSTKKRRKKPKVPATGIWNYQYTINGVATVGGKVFFILGNVTVMPLEGDIIHGGHALVNGQFINIHKGVRGKSPPPKSDQCDCVKKWHDSVFKYLKDTKCYCGHYYDYYNEGTFPPEELPFFEKPTRYGNLQVRLDNIYDLDEKRIQVAKDFKRIWDTDSVIHLDDDEDEIKRKPLKKKKVKSSKTCLGQTPKPEDYLRCALRRLRRINIAAKLPDIYLAPELVVWMRKRLYGPYTRQEKSNMKYKSNVYWTLFSRYALHGIPHVPVPKVEQFNSNTTWRYKQQLNDNFTKFSNRYRLELFRQHADFNNMMWPSMFQAQLPDKRFREIYFAYLFSTVEHLYLMRPYDSQETAFRYTQTLSKAYRCPPKGIENINT